MSNNSLVHRLAYDGDVAAGQLAVFQGKFLTFAGVGGKIVARFPGGSQIAGG